MGPLLTTNNKCYCKLYNSRIIEMKHTLPDKSSSNLAKVRSLFNSCGISVLCIVKLEGLVLKREIFNI